MGNDAMNGETAMQVAEAAYRETATSLETGPDDILTLLRR